MHRILFVLFMLVVAAAGVNQYLGAPISFRGADLSESMIKVAYATCGQEYGLPFKRNGAPPIEPEPLETLSSKDRNTLLACAAASGSYNFVQWALQNPPKELFSIDAKFGGKWPVELVARWRDGRAAADALRLLLEPNGKVWSVTTGPLMAGLYESATVEAAEYLTRRNETLLREDNELYIGHEDYPKYHGLTLAQYHAYNGRIEVAEFFADKGSRVAIPGKHLRHWILENDKDKKRLYDDKLDAFLEKHGVALDDRDEKGRTVLHLAATQRDEKLVTYLLDHGASANIADESGESPLYAAARDNQPAIVAALLAHGADPNLRNHQGQTPLHVAFGAGAWDASAALLDKGARLDVPDTLGRTAIFVCIERGCPLLDRLAAAGGSFAVLDNDKNSLLHAAAKFGGADSGMAQSLIARGAPINQKNIEGRTPLHIAAMQGNYALARLLLDKGASANEPDNLGNTPLHLAHAPEVVTILLDSGADPDLPNKAGDRPVNGPVERSQMLFHSPALARSGNDTLPRYFSAIRVGGGPHGVELITPTLGDIGMALESGDGAVSTQEVEFVPRSAALEFRVQQACEAGASLAEGGEGLQLPHLAQYSSWQDVSPLDGRPMAFRAAIQAADCNMPPVTPEKIMENVRREQPTAAWKWQAAAKTCVAGRRGSRCTVFVRPALRVLVKSGNAWKEAGILYTSVTGDVQEMD
jgi:ankyrin repeat protein